MKLRLLAHGCLVATILLVSSCTPYAINFPRGTTLREMKFGRLTDYGRKEGWVMFPAGPGTGLSFKSFRGGLIMVISSGPTGDMDIVALDSVFDHRVLRRVAWYETAKIFIVK